MKKKSTTILFFQRLFIWILYLFSGFILYSKKGYIYSFLINFIKVIYPLSIFWLQIRLKKRGHFFPIDPKMSTSQLWFNILPVLASLSTVILTTLNLLLFLINSIKS